MWICTDPDCNQYRRRIDHYSWEFKQDYRSPTGTKKAYGTINLNDYTLEEIEGYIKPYGYSLYRDTGLCRELIAECIFETDIIDFIDN